MSADRVTEFYDRTEFRRRLLERRDDPALIAACHRLGVLLGGGAR